jgi:hypothetical protein
VESRMSSGSHRAWMEEKEKRSTLVRISPIVGGRRRKGVEITPFGVSLPVHRREPTPITHRMANTGAEFVWYGFLMSIPRMELHEDGYAMISENGSLQKMKGLAPPVISRPTYV